MLCMQSLICSCPYTLRTAAQPTLEVPLQIVEWHICNRIQQCIMLIYVLHHLTACKHACIAPCLQWSIMMKCMTGILAVTLTSCYVCDPEH